VYFWSRGTGYGCGERAEQLLVVGSDYGYSRDRPVYVVFATATFLQCDALVYGDNSEGGEEMGVSTDLAFRITVARGTCTKTSYQPVSLFSSLQHIAA
jgi:hypothetical protein